MPHVTPSQGQVMAYPLKKKMTCGTSSMTNWTSSTNILFASPWKTCDASGTGQPREKSISISIITTPASAIGSIQRTVSTSASQTQETCLSTLHIDSEEYV